MLHYAIIEWKSSGEAKVALISDRRFRFLRSVADAETRADITDAKPGGFALDALVHVVRFIALRQSGATERSTA